MPFKSEAQRRWMHAAEARGEVPEGTASRWEHHTKDKKNLPEHVSKEPAVKKTAFSITDAGHKLDAAHYGADSEAAHKRHRATREYLADEPGLSVYHTLAPFIDMPGSMKGNQLSGLIDKLESRHLDYAAKKHEKGDNAYNPFGGLLTKSRHEEAEKKAYDIGAMSAYATLGLR